MKILILLKMLRLPWHLACFMQFGEKRYHNEGAYAVLKHPDFEQPSFHSFKAVERPKVRSYLSSYVTQLSKTFIFFICD